MAISVRAALLRPRTWLSALAVTAVVTLAVLAVGTAAARPAQRVVSTNLCTDQLLLRLVDRARIASVSYLARDPVLSDAFDAAAGIPVNHGLAEEILPLHPDLVLAMAPATRPTMAFIRRQGIPVLVLDHADGFAAIRRNIRALGAALGAEEEAERLIAGFDRDLGMPPEEPSGSAVVLQERGVTTGANSLADAVLHRAGLRNLAAALGVHAIGRVTLEQVVAARPDVIVVADGWPGQPSLAHQFLKHPALDSAGGTRVVVPSRLWNCGGPQAARAVSILRDAGRALRRKAAP